MKAQFVYENIQFQRGRDPKDVMGIGIQDIKDLGPLSKRSTHVLRKPGKMAQTSRGYMMWKLLNFINSKNQAGEPVGYADCVRYYFGQLKGQEWRRSFSTGQRINLNKYINRDKNRKYFINRAGKSYLERYRFFDDGIEDLTESVNFKRGIEPKEAMGIGKKQWENLSDGDILRTKRGVGVSTNYLFNNNSSWPWIHEGQYIVIEGNPTISEDDNIFSIGYKIYDTLDEARRRTYKGNTWYIDDTLGKAKNRFEIV